MKQLLFIGLSLFAIQVNAEDPKVDFPKLFQQALRIEGCRNEFDGLFESVMRGCYQSRTGLTWGIRSLRTTHFKDAWQFCASIPPHTKGVANGWRLPTVNEVDELYGDFLYISQRTGLQVAQHIQNGMGVFNFSLDGIYWVTTAEKVAKTISASSTFSFKDGRLGANVRAATPYLAFCVRKDENPQPRPAKETEREMEPPAPGRRDRESLK